MTKIYTTSPEHLYVNDYLIDINQIESWYNSKTWGGHNPSQVIRRLKIKIEEIHKGEYDLSDDNIYGLLCNITWVANYNYYIPDVVFYESPKPFYRYIKGAGDNRDNELYLIHYSMGYNSKDYPKYEIKRNNDN